MAKRVQANLIILSLVLSLVLPFTASAKIYIRVDQFSQEKFPIAITRFPNKSSATDPKGAADQIDLLIEKDLSFTSLFRFISKKAFLEDPEKAGFSAETIDFANWAVLDAQALVKGWYSLDRNGILIIEVHLFDVLTQKEIMKNKYTSSTDELPSTVHKISDAIIEALTGEPGVFQTKIAFVGNRTRNKEIYLMELDGRNVTQLTSNGSINQSPDWSKDGKLIVFTSFKSGKGSSLYIIDLNQKTIQGFPSLTGPVWSPAYSPISEVIAMTYWMKYDRGIFTFNPRTSELKKISKGGSIDVSPSFSPDGRYLAFVSDRSGHAQIYRQGLSGEEDASRLTFQGWRNEDPAWSPKGDKIAFAGMDVDGHADIFLMNTDGSNIERLTYDSKTNESPSWSPDGQFIIFASNRGGKFQLYVMRPNVNSEQKQITFSNYDHIMPAWSPRVK
jgi:TolB protein